TPKENSIGSEYSPEPKRRRNQSRIRPKTPGDREAERMLGTGSVAFGVGGGSEPDEAAPSPACSNSTTEVHLWRWILVKQCGEAPPAYGSRSCTARRPTSRPSITKGTVSDGP